MVIINPAPAALSPADLSLFYTTDELLSNSPILIFYGPTATSTHATHSRIQAHIFTPAGLHNYARLIISPTAAFYSAVLCLPREEQGDEICRGLAFSLYKYFAELPAEVKHVWEAQSNYSLGRLPSAPALFSDAHAAMVAARMVRVENVPEVISHVRNALGEQTLSWVDLDIVLPQGVIQKPSSNQRDSAPFDDGDDNDADQQRYGEYTALLKLFGESAFLPTSRLKRAPSKPTGLNRSQSFARKQKENLRREMCELLDTEENYVSKIQDLIQNVAEDFRRKAKHKSHTSTSPNEHALQGLFPPSLDSILEVNSGFLEAIRTILEDTENGAIEDIERTDDDIFVAPLRSQNAPQDVTGALAVARTLVEWFPRFGDCYSDYMSAHAQFPQLLKTFTKDSASSFSKRIQETGEQRLMSMLIEPVQRLPRYNLYIDNIVKQLPLKHPALKPFLKARDIISEICSRDVPSTQQTRIPNRLRKMVFSWPPLFNPQGRLITAIDFVELSPPYDEESACSTPNSGVFLLFPDYLVMLSRPSGCTMTARSILAELDAPKTTQPAPGSPELIFHQQMKLSDVFMSEHSNDNLLHLISYIPGSKPGRPRSRDRQIVGIRMFRLAGLYEGKVHRCVEEVTKAKVEGRFSESERDSGKWEVRSITGDLSFFSAVLEDAYETPMAGRGAPAKIQVIVDPAKFPKTPQMGEAGVEMVATVSLLGDGLILLEMSGSNGYATRDKLTDKEFVPVLTKRVGNFFQARNNIKNPELCEAFLNRNQELLKSLRIRVSDAEEGDQEPDGKQRAHSPVKMLSNLFGGSVGKESGRSQKLQKSPLPPGGFPRMMPPLPPAPSRGNSRDGELSRPTSSSRNAGFGSSITAQNAHTKLEETFAALVLAMHARKGNIVGRSVRSRSAADELAVNELYNSLLENPTGHELAAQASVNVLFATFEKFLRVAWKDNFGPVISHATLVALQIKSDSVFPSEFEDFFRMTFNEMAPHNQRSLTAVVRLLGDLLDGTANDGDRGILTAAFAEFLVPEGNANEFISLIDRFIQDIEILFPLQQSGVSTPSYGSVDSKTRSIAAGSLNSNTSLRKRFGFGALTRENSKSDNESKVGSLWRTLSKNGYGGESQPSSLSRAGHAYLGRSNSTDAAMYSSPKRPSSRDRPTVLGAFPFEHNESPQGRAWFGGPSLGTIGEGEKEVPSNAGPPRKKRRSSLSDLKTLPSANHTPTWSPQTPRNNGTSNAATRQTSASPRTPSPNKPSHIPTPTRTASPSRKENSPANPLERVRTEPLRPSGKGEEVSIKSHTPLRRRTDSTSAIPTLKSTGTNLGGLSERPTSGNAVKIPPSTPRQQIKPIASVTSPPKRLKLQSPHKLRERLQNQQRDIETAGKDMQAELASIGQELALQRPRLTTMTSSPIPLAAAAPIGNTKTLEARIAMLENRVRTTLEDLTSRTATIASDVSSSLQVSEARVKRIDQLYRDVNAENEVLYARFNEELEKVEKSIKRGKSEEEVQKRIKEQGDELARLRKENARLKREVAGLKAQLRD
jgi:hypothetical protein